MDINEFLNLTIRTLRNIRNVLFLLAFFVSQKEKSKEKEVDGKIGEIPWTHDWEKDDELTKLCTICWKVTPMTLDQPFISTK
jgi:hypothetical protein